MRKLILHIGHAKTGTTTLQETLRASHARLLDNGILYPRTTRFNNHKQIIPRFFGVEAAGKRLTRMMGGTTAKILANSDANWKLIEKGVKTHQPHTIVLSAEQFFGCGRHDCFGDFITGLQSLADEIQVVAYLRDPAGYSLSQRQQHLKHGNLPLPKFGARWQDALEPFMNHPNIKIAVHKFSRQDLIGQDVVTDFATRYLGSDTINWLTRRENDENTTISAEAMLVIEQIRAGDMAPAHAHVGAMTKKLSKAILRTDDILPGKQRPKYLPGYAQFIYDLRTDMDWVKETFGLEFKRPEDQGSQNPITIEHFKSSRTTCEINEARYDAMWKAILVAAKRDNSILGHYDEFWRNMGRWQQRLKRKTMR